MTAVTFGVGPVLEDYPEHAKLIGIIVTSWNDIEHALVMLLALCMGQQFLLIHPMVYALRNSVARLDIMEPTLLELFKQQKLDTKELASILAEARKVAKARNMYAHAVYGASDTLRILDLQEGIPAIFTQQDKNRPLKIEELTDALQRSISLSHRIATLSQTWRTPQPKPA